MSIIVKFTKGCDNYIRSIETVWYMNNYYCEEGKIKEKWKKEIIFGSNCCKGHAILGPIWILIDVTVTFTW